MSERQRVKLKLSEVAASITGEELIFGDMEFFLMFAIYFVDNGVQS